MTTVQSVPRNVALSAAAGRIWPWAALALLVPLSLVCARQAPYFMGVLGFTLFAAPHNMSELTFFFVGRGAVGSALPRAPRWALLGMLALMLPAFAYLVPGWVTQQQKIEVFAWHMRAVLVWLACMTAAAPLPRLGRVAGTVGLAAATWLVWDAPMVTAIVIAHLHHVTALVIAWLILGDRPERQGARPIFIAAVVATIAGTLWLLLGPAIAPGPEGLPGAGDAISSSIYFDGMRAETLDRWMAVYSFQLWLHYAVWLLLVPALHLLPSPRPRMLGLCIAVAVGASVLFWRDFAQTRVVYLALAGLHAYGEFPLMLFYRNKEPGATENP